MTVAHVLPTRIEHAAARILRAKIAERAANAARLEAERELLACLSDLKDEGTTNVDAGEYRIVVTTSMTRSTSVAALQEIRERVPEAYRKRLIEFRPSINVRELRFIEHNEPELFAIVSEAVTVKPAKPSVVVTLAGDA